MEQLGNILLHVALVVCCYSVVMSVVGAKTDRPRLVASARNALYAVSILVASCAGLLVACFLTDQFHVRYVHQYSNSTMPSFYKVAALWGGQDGSLLFWLLILCGYSTLAVFTQRRKNSEFLPYMIATLMTIGAFFLVLLVFAANPFTTMPFEVRDGRGLNPLLQNYYMVIHPPSLYLGYVGMTVPFSIAMAALMSGKLDNQWVIDVRRWTLTAWFFLSLGNLLGASWAYEVLGWGGYWAWDPVENAAFMPWLTATAFLHSIIIQEKRGMLRTWNMVLVILSFLLTITGTFLTRSGIISSVHSFAQSDIGYYFFGFLGLSVVASGSLVVYRLKELRSKNTLDSLASRESAFLFNNLVLVGSAFAILWGTLFPVLSEWVRGTKITVGPPFFNSVMVPIGLLLLLLTGVGPIVGWRKNTPAQLRRNFLWPSAAAVLASIPVLIWVSQKPYVVASFTFCAFVLTTVIGEYREGVAVRIRTLKEDAVTALLRLVATNRRRYGGYVVHIGIVLLFVGFTGEAFKKEREVQLKPQQEETIGSYRIRFEGLSAAQDPHKETVFANLVVERNGQPYTRMHPARVFFQNKVDGEPPQPNTEVAIKRSLAEDLYIALLTYKPADQTAFLKVVINPLVQFIWIGGLVLILGTTVVMWPESRRQSSRAVARMAAGILLTIGLSTAFAPSTASAITEEEISKKLVCQCGCNFPDLASCSCEEWAIPAKNEIRARLSRGEDEATILKYFMGRDGEKVLASPMPQGFNRAAWIVPAVAILAGISVVGYVVRRWKASTAETDSTAPVAAAPEDDRFRKEIDRELYGNTEG